MTSEEHKEIITAFPRLGFHDEVVKVICGLCKTKPETTYANYVAEFGIKYGLDGKGDEKNEFIRKVDATTK